MALYILLFDNSFHLMYVLNVCNFQEEASQVSETGSSWTTFPGQAFPLGVSEVDSGINFAIFSQHATAVTLCLSLPER